MLYMLPIFRWAPVPNTENKYWVNQLGEVLSLKSRLPKKLKPRRVTNGYMTVLLHVGAKPVSRKIHRLVYAAFVGEIAPNVNIDHIDRNTGNNTLFNLRECSLSQNRANMVGDRGATSRFKGVYFEAERRQWRAQIRKDGSARFLGRFHSEKDAAAAYNEAAKEVFGEFALLNEI